MITHHLYALGQKVIVTLNFCDEGMGFAGSLKWISRSTIGCRPVPPRVFKKWDASMVLINYPIRHHPIAINSLDSGINCSGWLASEPYA